MHTPAPLSLWLVLGRAPLTRGECGEDSEESRGGRGGPAGANPGRRVRGARGGWRGRRPLPAWRKLAPLQMATVSTRLGGAAKGAGDPAIARVGASVRASVSVSWCSAGLTVTLAGPAGPGSLLRVPLLGFCASSPSNSSLPAPPGSRSRPLQLSASTTGPPPPPPPPFPARRSRSPPRPPYPAARSAYRGVRRGEPVGEPRNPRSPPRRRPGAGGVRAPLSSSRSHRRARPAWAPEPQCTPQRDIFSKGGCDEWALEM